MNELERIEALAKHFGAAGPGVRVGIGDDAAVFDPGQTPFVWTIDAQVEGTHFETAWVSWEDIGWRSFMAAASDLAAMGAEPAFALSALVLASSVDDAALDALVRGQAAAARTVGAPVIGGNLARGKETSITTTLLGRAERPIARSGARSGDGIWLAGDVGLAAAGLVALMRDVQDARMSAALEAWRRPRARIEAGRELARSPSVTAAIDVSDGLARDADHIALASQVSLVFDRDRLLAHGGAQLVTTAATIGRDALDLALYGGEDYALLVTSAAPIPGFSLVGEVVPLEPGGARLHTRGPEGTLPLEPRGFDHFS